MQGLRFASLDLFNFGRSWRDRERGSQGLFFKDDSLGAWKLETDQD
jgi:hypothetical protein